MLRNPSGRNMSSRTEETIRERVTTPGAASRLSGANHSGESSATAAGTRSGIDEDGNTVIGFIYGYSEYGGADYIPSYGKATEPVGRNYIARIV